MGRGENLEVRSLVISHLSFGDEPGRAVICHWGERLVEGLKGRRWEEGKDRGQMTEDGGQMMDEGKDKITNYKLQIQGGMVGS